MASNTEKAAGGTVVLALIFWYLASRGEGRDPITDIGGGGDLGADDVPPNVLQWIPQIEQAIAQCNGTYAHKEMIMAIIWQESGGVNGLTGGAGEIGLMQIWPETARGLGYTDLSVLWDPVQNIIAGCRVLDQCAEASKAMNELGDYPYLQEMFQCYNAGPDDIGHPIKGFQYSLEVLEKFGATSQWIDLN